MRRFSISVFAVVLLFISSQYSFSQQERVSWKQEVPLPKNQRITLWADQGWLKAARLNERGELLWAVVLIPWDSKQDLRVQNQGSGVNIYGPNGEILLRNSLYDMFAPMVLRCNHSPTMPPQDALIDPAMFGLKHFHPLAFTDDGHLLTYSDSSEWIYIGSGPTGSQHVQSLTRLLPRKLQRGNLGAMAGSDGIRASSGELQVYDENGFLFAEQMSELLARQQLPPLDNLLRKKAPTLSIQYWLNDQYPLSLDSLRGSVVLLYFWAVWCPPCVRHLDSLQCLAVELCDHPFRILTVHTPSSSSRLDDFLKERRFTLPIGVDNGKSFEVYTQNAVPLYVLIDKAGVVRQASDLAPSLAVIKRLIQE